MYIRKHQFKGTDLGHNYLLGGEVTSGHSRIGGSRCQLIVARGLLDIVLPRLQVRGRRSTLNLEKHAADIFP